MIATDVENTVLDLASKKAEMNSVKICVQKVDMRQDLPFKDDSFGIVYAHLSLHYFNKETTIRIFDEIQRVL